MTPVQDAVIAPELDGADLLVSAQTGSGKTVAFGMAIAPTLLGDQTTFGRAAAPLALVIAPTRELAMQVSRELTWLYAKAGAVVTTCVGGMDTRTERRALDRGAHIVVATPGRLCDHIKRNNIDLTDIRAVVLDEADEMLDLGFREDLEFILGESPETRRTLMFSATVPAAIAQLAKGYQRNAQRVSVVSDGKQHSDIEYRALTVNPRDTENAILNILRFYEAKNAIVFCNTRAAVAHLTTRLTNRNFSVVALSGELSQQERTNALQSLRDGRARVCVATDVAARGIDLPNLELVIHADLPSNADTLLHRSGRTGRAGRKGVSALIVPPKMRSKATRLLGWAKLSVEWALPPSASEVNAADQERLLNDEAWTTPAPEDAIEFVGTLVERYSPEQLATAFVNLYRSRGSAPEELSNPGDGKENAPRMEFGKSIWFTVSTGRNDGAEPRTILPMLCRVADLTRDDIGAIRVQPRHSYVEVAEGAVPKLVNALGPDMKAEDGVTLTRLDGVPDFGPKPAGRPERSGERPDRGPKPAYDKKPAYDTSPKPAPRAKPAYDPDAPKPSYDKPRPPREDAPAAEYKPRAASDKPRNAPFAKPKRDAARPPKSHKTERTPMKAGDKPKAKPVWKDKPAGAASDNPAAKAKSGAKAVWKKPAAEGAPARAPKAEGGYNRAADASKRFVPPGKGKKPAAPRGAPKGPKK
jgi:ATP-dependent RNA helicase DeaD